jgi:hypothetical protein
MVPVEVMWHQLEQNDSLKRFIRHFKECDEGNITLVMQYMYKTFENMFTILIFMFLTYNKKNALYVYNIT